jgi:hypothetical protein
LNSWSFWKLIINCTKGVMTRVPTQVTYSNF